MALALACGALFAAGTTADAGTASGAARAAGGTAPQCSAHTLAVRISDPGAATETLRGWLCHPRGHRPGTVQLLVHGATYNHRYWDFPVGGGYYSYVRAATAAGYATFNVDRVGAGDSSHPPAVLLDPAAGAVALHDVVSALRAGSLDGHAFRHVVWVGHSLGSNHAWYVPDTGHDLALSTTAPATDAIMLRWAPATIAP